MKRFDRFCSNILKESPMTAPVKEPTTKPAPTTPTRPSTPARPHPLTPTRPGVAPRPMAQGNPDLKRFVQKRTKFKL